MAGGAARSMFGTLRLVLIVGISVFVGGMIQNHLSAPPVAQSQPVVVASMVMPRPEEDAVAAHIGKEAAAAHIRKVAATAPEVVVVEKAGAKQSTRPVVMIIADDLRPQFGHLGYNTVTPNIDRLAGESLVFERAYCNAPACNPSRSSFIAGVMPDVSKVYAFEATTDEMGGDAKTIFNKMRTHGYIAMGVGKLFHWEPIGFSFSSAEGSRPGSKQIGPYFPEMYDQEWGCSPNEENGGTCTPDVCAESSASAGDCKMGRIYLTDLPEENLFDHRVATEAHRLLGIASKAWHRRRKPSIVGIGFHHPHTKWVVPRALWESTLKIDVQPAKFHEPPKGAPDYAFGDINVGGGLILVDGSEVPDREYWAKNPAKGIRRMPDHANVELRRGYMACITFMDKQVGRVLDSMDTLGLSNDTVVLFFSDHGYGVGEGGHWGKSSLYEIDTRVPLIIRDPSIQQSRGRRTKVVVELIDLWKTIVDLGGLPYDNNGRDYYARRDGRSLRRILQSPDMSNHQWGKDIALTIMPKCRPGLWDSVPFGCGGKSFQYDSRSVIGYAARSSKYRYVAWMPFNSTLDAVDWSLAPVDEELYEDSNGGFDDWDRVQLLDTKSWRYGAHRSSANALLDRLRQRARERLTNAWGSYPWRTFDGNERFITPTQKIYSNVGYKHDKYPK